MNDNKNPAPMVPADVDLRGFDFMPLMGDRLFKSATWIAGSAEAKVAMLRLWWHAYAHEVPAASLPADDALLADYAGYGVGVKAWRKVKQQAMRGFVLCSDGRMYHPIVAELALAGWKERVRNREKQRAWRERNGNKDGDVTVTRVVTKPARNAGEGQGEGQLKGQGEEDTHTASARPTPAAAICIAVKGAGLGAVNPGDPRLDALLVRGATSEHFLAAVPASVTKRNPWAYLLATVEGQLTEAAGIANGPRAAPGSAPAPRGSSRADQRAATIAGLTGNTTERTDHATGSERAIDVESRVVGTP